MKPKNQQPSSAVCGKLTILSLFFLFVLYAILRSNTSPLQSKRSSRYSSLFSFCNKIPHSLSQSLIHYATSTTTPQQKLEEISVTQRVLENKSPCNFLVFGLGLDSLMWASLNYGGRTIFLDDSKEWIDNVTKQMPSLEMYHVTYDSKVSQAPELYKIGKTQPCKVVGDPRFSKCPLAIKDLPGVVYEIEWDLIMVDAPVGFLKDFPGRMKVIYTAGLMARNRRDGETDVFVHDVYRDVEDSFSRAFLCESYMTEEVVHLRHFTVPSHRALGGGSRVPFCPLLAR